MQSNNWERDYTEKEIIPKKKRDVDREKANKREPSFMLKKLVK